MTTPYLPSRWLITAADASDDPDIFPFLVGQTFLQLKTPVWSTDVKTSVSGIERRRALWSYPIWKFKVGYEVLRDAPDKLELQRLITFFNAHQGQFQEFFYYDRSDHSVTGQTFGTGDGVTTTFQLKRTTAIGSTTFTEPVRGVSGTPTIYVNGAPNYYYDRTNLCLQSQAMNTSWTATDLLVFANTGETTAPDSTYTAEKIVEANTTAWHGLYPSSAISISSGTFTGSVYVKYLNRQYIKLVLDDGSTTNGAHATFDVLNGTVASGANFGSSTGFSATCTSAGDGWYRISVTTTLPGPYARFVINGTTTSSAAPFSPYAGSDTMGWFVWGAQVEADPYSLAPTAYIATTTTAVTVPASFASSSAMGVVSFATPPAIGAVLTWTGNFFFLCRFAKDDLDVAQMMNGLWSNTGLEFQTCKN